MKLVSPVHLGFERCLTLGIEARGSFAPAVFRGNVFFRQRGMFPLERGWSPDCIVLQPYNTKIDVFLPRDLFYLLPPFLPVARVILTHKSLSVASVNMQ